MKRRLIVFTGMVSAMVAMVGPPARASATPPVVPRAHAWVVRVTLPGTGDVLTIADVGSRGGDVPLATAAPVALAGRDPDRVTATLQNPDIVRKKVDYTDPTESLRFEGGFAEAHVATDTATARAGLGAGTGSGFAFANEHFTYEQQEQLLSQWKELNDAIVGPLNGVLGTLEPALGSLGLHTPELEGISPVGLIDIARANDVASSASTSSTPGFASARAQSAAADVRLFGGFIVVRGIVAEAVAESAEGADTRTARATAASITIAGIEMASDDGGLRAAGNDLLPVDVVGPVMDTVLGSLSHAGLTIRAAHTAASRDGRSADVLEVAWDSPAGRLLISIGHADAIAPTVAAIVPPSSGSTSDIPVELVEPPLRIFRDPTRQTESFPAAETPDVVARGPGARTLGPEAARALRIAFLAALLGASAMAIGGPILARRPARRITKGAPT